MTTHYVYRHFDRSGTLLYIGCTSDTGKRETLRRNSGVEWANSIASTQIEGFDNKRQALDAERAAIESERPLFNVRYAKPLPPRPPRSIVEIHGYALRVIREARGRKVADLCESLDVDRSYITHIENGSKRRVSPEFYNALLNELQIEDYRALLASAPIRVDAA